MQPSCPALRFKLYPSKILRQITWSTTQAGHSASFFLRSLCFGSLWSPRNLRSGSRRSGSSQAIVFAARASRVRIRNSLGESASQARFARFTARRSQSHLCSRAPLASISRLREDANRHFTSQHSPSTQPTPQRRTLKPRPIYPIPILSYAVLSYDPILSYPLCKCCKGPVAHRRCSRCRCPKGPVSR